MESVNSDGQWLPNFRRVIALLRPHARLLIIGLVAALGVGATYTVSISSVIPLLKVIIADHESLVDWMHRIETQRRLDVAIAPDLPDDPEGLALDYIRPDSRSEHVLSEGDRIIAIDGQRMSGFETMAYLAAYPERSIDRVLVRSMDGVEREVQLRLRAHHWWSQKLRVIASILPASKDPESRMRTLMLVMGGLVMAAILGGLCRWANEGLIATAVQRAMHDLRTRLASHVLHLPLEWHARQPPGDTLGRFATDIGKIEIGLTTLFGKAIREPIKVFGVLVMALLIDSRLLLIALLCVPVGVVALRWFGRAVKNSQKRASRSWGRLLDHLGEKITGIRVVKAYGMQDAETQRFSEEDRRLTNAQTHIEVVDAATKPVLETLAAVAAAAFVLYGGSRVFAGQLEPNLFFTALICLGAIFDPVRKLGNVNNRVQAADASAHRIFELLDKVPEEAKEPTGYYPDLPLFRDSIEFRNVSFAYPDSPDKPVLRDVSVSIPKGKLVALVGPNGSGKTTLMALLMRFYDPLGGRILIDGKDIHNHSLASLRRQIGLVTQDTVIFSDTIRDNIAYGANGEATPELIRRAASRAHCEDFIAEVVVQNNGSVLRGYDAPITPRTLSGGQRQRLALARAILRDPPILILDEATSQIDSESEARIRQALAEITPGRTSFVIAHRYSTIADADMILVLNEGSLVAVGTHAELLEQSPFYVNLCQTQFAVGV